MIVNLNLADKLVIIIGGGNEALKRINSLLKENCQILIISDVVNNQIKCIIKKENIKFKKQKIQNPTNLLNYNPFMIITTTNDKKLNQKIMNYSKKRKIIAYSSDNSESSDFANPSIIDFENTIQIAIFTGGRSPAMAKKLRIESEKIFRKLISKEEIGQIKIQKIVRELAKKTILTQIERKRYLDSIMSNKEIEQLIKDDKLKRAEKVAITLLRKWK